MIKKRIKIIVLSMLMIASGCKHSNRTLFLHEMPVGATTCLDYVTQVEFQNPELEEIVRDILDKPTGMIMKSDIWDITELNINCVKIDSFAELEDFKNLKKLELCYTKISSLEGIEVLTNLESLIIEKNNIEDIQELSKLASLKELDITGNNIADLSPLENINNLESLSIGDCEMEYADLSAIENLVKLKYFYASNCGISNIDVLHNMKELACLCLPNNNITDISVLKTLEKLNYLSLEWNKISDISPLENRKELEYLRVSNNTISDISVVESLDKLDYLNLAGNQITEISTLENMWNMQKIDWENVNIKYNPIPGGILEKYYSQEEYEESTDTYSGDVPKHTFELVSFYSEEDHDYHTTKITIKDTKSGKIIQEIIPNHYSSSEEIVSDKYWKSGFEIFDMNFDGYEDICISDYETEDEEQINICWVWDEEKGQYVYDYVLSSIGAFWIDSDNELINVYVGEWLWDPKYYERNYKFIDGVLTLIKEIQWGYLDEKEPEQAYKITYELIDNQWVMTAKIKMVTEKYDDDY
ncbi:leucine-rich repeat domain-containing protein [Anaerosporobacter sp.]|uniref:leucine-rich repeat domain-containing protein n=1 Tax=Anaerosporobacter sp. TaxID=1872529 RepID=UPI00286F2DDC|nr:leucine-rich repeat domain-containing protein [Anaerosporobacter sp.]